MTKKEKTRQYIADIEKAEKRETDKEQKKTLLQVINKLKGIYYILFNEFYIEQ
jgi:hypothetical protein